MSENKNAWQAWIVWAFGIILLAFNTFNSTRGGSETITEALILTVVLILFLSIGCLIISRLPTHPIGWIFLIGSFLFIFQDLSRSIADTWLEEFPGAWVAAWVQNWAGNLGFGVLILFTFLFFPNGRLPSRRWRPLAWLTLLGLLTSLILDMFRPGMLASYPELKNPIGIAVLGPMETRLSSFNDIVLSILFILIAVSIVLRYRRSTAIERQQIKWVAYAAILGGITFALVPLALFFISVHEMVLNIIFISFVASIPITLGISILRYRLWDIDIIIRRTLIYGGLTVTLALVYFGSVVLLQALFQRVTGGQSTIAIVLSTLLIAALFTPLRRRIQRDIDRRFYRNKYNAEQILEQFAGAARSETDLESLAGRLVEVVQETMQPEHASLWLKGTPRR